MKKNTITNNPQNLKQFKRNITNVISGITRGTLREVARNLLKMEKVDKYINAVMVVFFNILIEQYIN